MDEKHGADSNIQTLGGGKADDMSAGRMMSTNTVSPVWHGGTIDMVDALERSVLYFEDIDRNADKTAF